MGQYTIGGGGLIQAIIELISDNADDLAPGLVGADADPFAERLGGIRPVLTRELHGDDRYQRVLVNVCPRDAASLEHRVPQGFEIARCDEFVATESTIASIDLRELFDKDRAVEKHAVHRDGRTESHRLHARDLPQAIGDLLVRLHDLLRIADERFRNRDTQGLNLFRTREAGLDLTEGDERAHHESRDD
jgi:hypothetical protein